MTRFFLTFPGHLVNTVTLPLSTQVVTLNLKPTHTQPLQPAWLPTPAKAEPTAEEISRTSVCKISPLKWLQVHTRLHRSFIFFHCSLGRAFQKCPFQKCPEDTDTILSESSCSQTHRQNTTCLVNIIMQCIHIYFSSLTFVSVGALLWQNNIRLLCQCWATY